MFVLSWLDKLLPGTQASTNFVQLGITCNFIFIHIMFCNFFQIVNQNLLRPDNIILSVKNVNTLLISVSRYSILSVEGFGSSIISKFRRVNVTNMLAPKSYDIDETGSSGLVLDLKFVDQIFQSNLPLPEGVVEQPQVEKTSSLFIGILRNFLIINTVLVKPSFPVVKFSLVMRFYDDYNQFQISLSQQVCLQKISLIIVQSILKSIR